MRLLELFFDDSIGPFCLVEYVLESKTSTQFFLRFLLFIFGGLPMFCFVAPVWIVWQMLK